MSMPQLWDWCVKHGRQPSNAAMLNLIAIHNGIAPPDPNVDPDTAATKMLVDLQARESLRRRETPKRPAFAAIVRDKDGKPKFDSIEGIPRVMWDLLKPTEQQEITARGGYPSE